MPIKVHCVSCGRGVVVRGAKRYGKRAEWYLTSRDSAASSKQLDNTAGLVRVIDLDAYAGVEIFVRE